MSAATVYCTTCINDQSRTKCETLLPVSLLSKLMKYNSIKKKRRPLKSHANLTRHKNKKKSLRMDFRSALSPLIQRSLLGVRKS